MGSQNAQLVRPLFTSERYGTPAYGQLATGCAEEIKRGAEDGSEMGAFHDLYPPQREDSLRARIQAVEKPLYVDTIRRLVKELTP